jgi:hypothetical protein
MRAPRKARALVGGTIAAGAAIVAAAPFEATPPSLAALALLGAAVVATELLQVESDESSLDPGDAHGISFSSGVHIAIAIIVGPWTAAATAAFGVLAVDRLRGSGWTRLAFNASVFALAAFAGGWAFRLAGGESGTLELPHDFVAVLALAVAYYTVDILLTSAVVAFHGGIRVLGLARDAARDALPSSASEAGLGVALALIVFTEPWAVLALAPLVFAVFRAYERLAALRRETARALETFANVVDERDEYTFQHSDRVAEHVRLLAEALELPPRTVGELRWAGRLHDLGKVSVDTSILHKPGRLDETEWEVLRKHPRLSARLLRRFRLASEYARAVEFHHERFDGEGYYGVPGGELSLAAHFLIVADTYDAMTSDRPYRDGLPTDVALAEIERNAGGQFHPVVAKAFVALRRGFDPLRELSPSELAELRSLADAPASAPPLRRLLRPETVALGGLLGALVAVGFGATPLAVPALAAAALGFGATWWRGRTANRLAATLANVVPVPDSPAEKLAVLVGALRPACHLRWAGVVEWRERECVGSLGEEWTGEGEAPTDTALTSWLVREAESVRDVVVAEGEELGRQDPHVVVPLASGGRVAGYLFLAVRDPVPRAVVDALRASAGAVNGLVGSGRAPATSRVATP